MLCTLSHNRFRMTLMHKAQFYEGTHVILVNEAYTSKTCGRCGWINDKLGGAKVFRCRECGIVASRDHNGAMNIALRFLTGSAEQDWDELFDECYDDEDEENNGDEVAPPLPGSH
jgi:putative transposase